ncbi:23S rRNA pseudouridine(1911/1915/1917) synthase RluD [Sodalis endosymbiont of Henestaris halophilus]|uniref:23S rRNA pseudouridine(1911/1915/1917) synthase RluD n=1 Tax=Sodalis endosymbiont of Henestaris halophilus TaxID=1929246 RepID=UPI000BC0037C|nr:23S rRNA pseudouridine(1911/1915/1917) synthase RluD [Sodalis endosymbiont of Henestaris halophilus]SNC58893.1 Ribosomal large subunit pseudouridine synthase D [Sodalis endosymbiont of Henestaris halophilus]
MIRYKQINGTVNVSQRGQRLDQTLAKTFPNYSRSRIKAWILAGLVRVNGHITTVPKKKMLGGEFIEMQISIKESCWEAQDIPLNIIYEDDDILIINKPCNLLVHPGAGHADGTLLNALLHYFPPILDVPRAGIIHRLDKDTTGLMVLAKTVPAQIRLLALMQARKIIREYEAIAIGKMTYGGTVEQPIARHPTKRMRMAVNQMGKPAVTYYRIIEHFRAHTHLRLRLETGRTHQIRVHMAHINHALVGDPLYGTRSRPTKNASESFNEVLCRFNRQALHATLLQFYHPITSIKMEWYAPLPQDMSLLITQLKKDNELCQKN